MKNGKGSVSFCGAQVRSELNTFQVQDKKSGVLIFYQKNSETENCIG